MRKQISVLAAAGILSAVMMTGCSSEPAETTAAATAATTAEETTAEETTAQESEEAAEGQKESADEETEKEAGAVSQTEPLVVYLNDFDAAAFIKSYGPFESVRDISAAMYAVTAGLIKYQEEE